MIAPNLVLRYKIDGDNRVHTRGAVRIRVDGCGALVVYTAEGGKAESVNLNSLQSLTIHSIAEQPSGVPAIIQ
jgi:hypothetical protein